MHILKIEIREFKGVVAIRGSYLNNKPFSTYEREIFSAATIVSEILSSLFFPSAEEEVSFFG